MNPRTVAGSAPAVLLFVLLWSLSSIPSLQPPPLGFAWQDKVYHLVAYLGYGLSLCLLAWAWRWRWPTTAVLVAGLLTAVLDEWHQSWVPGRQADVADIAADMLGIVAALAAWALSRCIATRRRTRG